MITVLHVDDEPVLSDITKLSLERSGKYCVETVQSASEALDLLQSGKYECIISDYEMPEMNGLELLKAVRAINPDIPFILFSGRGRESVIIEALNSGADFYLQKGGEPRSQFVELEHKISYAIEQHNTKLALKRRDAILEAVSLAANLVLTSQNFAGTIHEILTLFGLATEMDRVYLYTCNVKEDKTGIFSQRLPNWSRPGIPDKNSSNATRQPYLQMILKFYRTHFNEGKPVTGSIKEMNPFIEEMLISEEIKSIGLFPIFVEHQLWGCIGFEDLLSEREWREVEVDAIFAGAGIIGSALTQHMMNLQIAHSNAEYKNLYSMVRLMCDTVPDMIWAKDLDNRYIFANKAICQNLLCVDDTQEPIGKTNEYFSLRCRDESLPDVTWHTLGDVGSKSDNIILNSQKTGRFEEIGTVRGKNIHLDVIKTPLWNEQGEMIGTVGCARDITEEQIISSRMTRQNTRYENIFHKIHIGLVICQTDGIIIDMNRRARELLIMNDDILPHAMFPDLPFTVATGLNTLFADAIRNVGSQKGTIIPDPSHMDKKIYYEFVPIHNDQESISEILVFLDEHYQE